MIYYKYYVLEVIENCFLIIDYCRIKSILVGKLLLEIYDL